MKKSNPSRARQQAVKYRVSFKKHDGDCFGKISVFQDGSLFCDFVQTEEAAIEFTKDLGGVFFHA